MANETEQLARELLAAEYRADGLQPIADDVLTRPFELLNSDEKLALRAIVAALQQAQQPGAQAVAWAVQLADGSIGTLGWQDMRTHDWCQKFAVLRDGARYVYAYAGSPPPPLPEGVSEALSDIDFTEDEANEVMDYVLEHGPRLIPTEALQQMRRVLIESARLAAKGGV